MGVRTWGQLTALEKMDEKIEKRKHAKKSSFYVYVIF